MYFDKSQVISIFDAADVVEDMLRADLVPFLHGSPAIGKSGLMRAIAEKFNLKLIDVRIAQMDPCDLNGLPDLSGEFATFRTFDTFPVESTPIPEGYSGWLVFLDEMTSADEQRQAAAYKLVLDRMVGNKKLHSKVRIAAAGNLETDGAIVNVMSSALVSRFAHLAVKEDLRKWLDKIAYAGKYDQRITAFLEFKPDAFYTFDPNNPTRPYSGPRPWEAANKFLKVLSARGVNGTEIEEIPYRMGMGGIIGHGTASELHSFLKYAADLPTRKQILDNPTGFEIPRGNPGVLYALTGLLSDMINKDNADTLMKAIDRLPAEYKVVTLRAAIKRNGTAFMSIPQIGQWCIDNADLVR